MHLAMKPIILFFSVLISFCSFTQEDVRTFYQTYSALNYTTSMFEYNNEAYFVSIKDSSSASLKIVCGKLDDELNTSNYRYQYLFNDLLGVNQLSGSAVNGNLLQLAILTTNFSSHTSVLSYITIDLTTFLVLSNISESATFNQCFAGSLSKNGHLITYISDVNGVLSRYDNDITSFSTASIEIVGEISLSGSYKYKQSCFEIYDGNEFVLGSSSLNKMKCIKRNNQGVYSSRDIEFESTTNSMAMTVLSNGNIVTANPRSFCILNNELDSIGYGNFSTGIGVNQSQLSRWEIYCFGNKVYDLRPIGKKYIYDLSMNLEDSIVYERRFHPEGLFTMANQKFLYGQVKNPSFFNMYESLGNIYFNTSRIDLFVMKNNGLSEFTEYGKTFIHDSIEFLTGSCGTSFINASNELSGYNYKVNGQKANLIFYNSDQVIGRNQQNNLSGLFGRYNKNANVLPGPVYSNPLDFNQQMDKYNRGYYVTKQMIEDHLAILFYGNPDYIAPHGIREWPAHGDISIGEAENIADFVDVNQNGIYEPMLGDYPKIYGDQCLLNIYHQNKLDPTNNDLEVHQYFFTYDCDTSEILRNTVFENMRVINRGENLDSTYVGSYIDFDLGGKYDDYVGTNVELGMIYIYNSDELDLSYGASIGFGTKIPAQGMLVLNGMKLKNNGNDKPSGVAVNESINGNGFGDGLIDNEYYTLESSQRYSYTSSGIFSYPVSISEYWNVLSGKYQTGEEKLFVPNVPIRYDYFGTSDPLFYATRGYDHGNNSVESTSQDPGDKSILGGSGPGLFASGDTINYLTAHITSFDTTDTSVPISTDKLFADAAWLKNAFATNDLGCGKTFGAIQNDLATIEIEKYDVNVYPNPFHNELIITNLGNEESNIFVYDLNGNLLISELSNENAHKINLELKSGIYILKVENNLGSVVKRIVKY